MPGVEVVEVDLAPFSAAAALLYEGSFVAERYGAVGEFVAAHLDEVDPVVGPIILAGADHSGWSVFRASIGHLPKVPRWPEDRRGSGRFGSR